MSPQTTHGDSDPLPERFFEVRGNVGGGFALTRRGRAIPPGFPVGGPGILTSTRSSLSPGACPSYIGTALGGAWFYDGRERVQPFFGTHHISRQPPKAIFHPQIRRSLCLLCAQFNCTNELINSRTGGYRFRVIDAGFGDRSAIAMGFPSIGTRSLAADLPKRENANCLDGQNGVRDTAARLSDLFKFGSTF